jgi:hypothetical protein
MFMKKHDDYLHVSCLIVGYLTDKLTATEQSELEDWVNASDDHLHMMADFSSIDWHAQQARFFEEPDKIVSWHLIQLKVACLPGTPPLPDLREIRWTVERRASVMRLLRAVLLRQGLPVLRNFFTG